MQFKVKLIVAPGDKTIQRAKVTVESAEGVPMEGQVILEGEKIETDVAISEGQRMVVLELERPTVINPDDKTMAILADLTPSDPLKRPPPTEATPKHADPKHADPKAHEPKGSVLKDCCCGYSNPGDECDWASAKFDC